MMIRAEMGKVQRVRNAPSLFFSMARAEKEYVTDIFTCQNEKERLYVNDVERTL
jgi:hypothetical protein